MPLSGYHKPASGIPQSDLAPAVSGRLNGAQPLYLGATGRREPYSIWLGSTNIPIQASGVTNLIGLPLYEGDVVTNLTFISGATALTMGSNADGHLWFALYDPSGTLLAQTADQGGAATWAANTVKTLALSAPQTIATTGLYYAALMVNAGTGGSPTVPSMRGTSVASTAFSTTTGWPAGRKVIVASSGTALGATAPAGPITLTAITNAPYVMTS